MASMLALAFAPSRIGAQELADSLADTPETKSFSYEANLRLNPHSLYAPTSRRRYPWNQPALTRTPP